jgi:GNAT superfamily N-acetyltransferase
MNSIAIRRAVLADADLITAYNRALAEETEGRALVPAVIQRGVSRLLAEPARGVYYVAEQGGRVIGQLLITYEFSDWRDSVFWWIQSVYVHPAHRRQGVYRGLHEHVAAAARAAGDVCGLRLYVDRHNTPAQAVYRQLGLHPSGYELYEVDWHPAP